MQTPQATASLPTFRKGVHCTKALRPLTRAVRAMRCAVRFANRSVGQGGPSPQEGSETLPPLQVQARCRIRSVGHREQTSHTGEGKATMALGTSPRPR